jgi:hypothetical protein
MPRKPNITTPETAEGPAARIRTREGKQVFPVEEVTKQPSSTHSQEQDSQGEGDSAPLSKEQLRALLNNFLDMLAANSPQSLPLDQAPPRRVARKNSKRGGKT